MVFFFALLLFQCFYSQQRTALSATSSLSSSPTASSSGVMATAAAAATVAAAAYAWNYPTAVSAAARAGMSRSRTASGSGACVRVCFFLLFLFLSLTRLCIMCYRFPSWPEPNAGLRPLSIFFFFFLKKSKIFPTHPLLFFPSSSFFKPAQLVEYFVNVIEKNHSVTRILQVCL